jgi:hypothetical protein
MAHQYISQLDRGLIEAVLGNVGTIISFGVGAKDAELLSEVFKPVFTLTDFINLDRHMIYLKMAINGRSSQPFSAKTLPPFHGFEFQGNREKIVRVSRQRYAGRRKDIEAKINRWSYSSG